MSLYGSSSQQSVSQINLNVLISRAYLQRKTLWMLQDIRCMVIH